MSLNEITTLIFTVLTLVFAVWGFSLFARMAGKVIRALDVYIAKNSDDAPAGVEKE
ncbi:hypothetical protein KQI65_09020 [bacterium]|nr:hypothetical protein [bacterium]